MKREWPLSAFHLQPAALSPNTTFSALLTCIQQVLKGASPCCCFCLENLPRWSLSALPKCPFPSQFKVFSPLRIFQLLKTYFFNHLIVFIASLLLWTVGCKWAGTHGWSVHWFIHSPDIMLSRQQLLHSHFPNDWIHLWGGIINILFKMLCLWYVE